MSVYLQVIFWACACL